MSQPDIHQRKLLIVEDDPGLQKQLKWCFPDYDVTIVSDRKNTIEKLHLYQYPVVTLDLGLPPDPSNASEGLATLEQILSVAPETKVIVVTGNDDRENALKAIDLGAYDFYQKPIASEIISLIVDRAFRLSDLERENRRLTQMKRGGNQHGIIGCSPQIMEVFRLIEKIAPADVTTLLLGESGTGKELFAQALHNLSPRKDGPFIAINCAAIPENLLESELFGHEKGAFTDAKKKMRGKIEYADKGTLFLDEVGDLPQPLQAKLLRFLQERVIERIGGREEIPVDVRIICATHQDLSDKMRAGQFREDLYYRISEVSIKIPRLSDRAGDAVLLAKHFTAVFSEEQGIKCRLKERAITAIGNYGWPGNVRELENRIRRAVIMCENGQIEAADLELSSENDPLMFNLKKAREDVERNTIFRAISHSNGNITRTAELLGISRPTLYDLLDKYNLRS